MIETYNSPIRICERFYQFWRLLIWLTPVFHLKDTHCGWWFSVECHLCVCHRELATLACTLFSAFITTWYVILPVNTGWCWSSLVWILARGWHCIDLVWNLANEIKLNKIMCLPGISAMLLVNNIRYHILPNNHTCSSKYTLHSLAEELSQILCCSII